MKAFEDLTDAIAYVLDKNGPLRPKDIFLEIIKSELYFKENGAKPSEEQINARISKKIEKFVRRGNKVHLVRKIFTRLTSSEKLWELPSYHKWKKSNQNKNKKGISYENKYGFGHEEWLFNQRFNVNGYQYGYIRGLIKVKSSIDFLDEVHLYTVRKENHQNNVYYLGLLRNVEIILEKEPEYSEVSELYNNYFDEMMSEIENEGCDNSDFRTEGFTPVIKFKLSEANLKLEDPLHLPNFSLNTYKRFQPFELIGSIEDLFNAPIDLGSAFIPGKASQTSRYGRGTTQATITITKIHTEIIEALEQYLKPIFSLSLKNISIEKTRFVGNIADVVIQNKNKSIDIFEIKTSHDCRRNMRDAISQLLDYALHAERLKVNKLIMVSPAGLSLSDLAFLNSLKKSINFEIEYLCYSEQKTFIKYQ